MAEPPSNPPPLLGYANSRMQGRARRSRPWVNWIGLPAWAVITVVVLGGCGFALAGMGLGLIGPYAMILLTIGLALLMRAIRDTRLRRARDLLLYVDQAVRLNLPIPAMLWAAQQSEPKGVSRRIDRMRVLLEHGSTISQALGDVAPQLPTRTLRLIEVAERLGQLPATLSRLARPKVVTPPAVAEQETFYLTYPPSMLFVMAGVTSLMTIFVIPKFESIFRDFKIPLPELTKDLLAFYRNEYIQPVLGIVALIWLGQVFASSLESKERSFVGHLLDRLYWHIPIVHRRILDRGMADLCDVVARAVTASWPLEQALDQASEIQANDVLRGRIKAWARGIRSGQSISASAKAAKMPQLLVSMLMPIHSNEDLAQSMAFLATHYRTKFNRLEILLKAAYVPFVVALMGIAVGFICLALFQPLVQMINVTSIYTRLR